MRDEHDTYILQGLGIALVAASRAKVPVLIVDSSQASIDKGLKFAEKLLAKDVAKERITQADSDEARARMTTTTNIEDLKDVDMVIEAVPVCLDAQLVQVPITNMTCRKFQSSKPRSSLSWQKSAHHTLSSPPTPPPSR